MYVTVGVERERVCVFDVHSKKWHALLKSRGCFSTCYHKE